MKIKMMLKKMIPVLRRSRPLYFPLLFCYLELLVHFYAFGSFRSIGWIMAFSLGFGFFFSFLTSVFPGKVNRVLVYVFSFLITLVFEIQLVYYAIFKGFAPLSAVKLGGQAITNFTGAALEGVRSVIWLIVLLLIPFIALVVIGVWQKPKFSRPQKWYSVVPLGVSVAVLVSTVGIMAVFFSGSPSLFTLFNSSGTPTDVSVANFGISVTMTQELRYIVFPEDDSLAIEQLSTKKYGPEYQVDPSIDFLSLYEKAPNDELRNLTAALSNMPVTMKNQYTGMFEGYNLIAICAEAFAPEFIDPELTPTLHKMINGGFVFDNFYAAFPNTTTDGEYAFCMGLWPDHSRGKTESSFGLSSTNYLPYCYGNLFGAEGALTKAYHNYTAEFYHRNYTHENMGYDFVAGNSGLDIEMTWPSSDYDMMVQSVDDYIDSGERFVAYYMTFSGHYQYTMENAMSVKNWGEVEHLDYSDPVKAYIACNLELEKAMTYLLERLESAGIAEKTLIVLTTDHFPYGLTIEEYAELSGRDINDVFDKQKNSFICYVPGMEPVHVSNHCSSVDILPTVLNLLGYTYDSRLMAGQDALAENVDHVAILSDGSFIGDGFSYDASRAYFQYDVNSDDAERRAADVYYSLEKLFRVSAQILNNDYYSYAYSTESSGEEIFDPSIQYNDVGIMTQAPVYYVLTNDIMDHVSEEEFGLYRDFSVAELFDILYRVASRPAFEATDVSTFKYAEKYGDAVAWAYAEGILRDDGLIPNDLDTCLDIGKACLIIARASEYFGLDTSVDEAYVQQIAQKYPELNAEVIRASIFCKAQEVIVGDGSAEYVYVNSAKPVNRHFAVNASFKLCTYMLGR